MVNQSLVGADLRERFAERERARRAADPAAWERLVSKTPEQRAEYLRQPREHGFADMAALLAGTVTMTAPALGQMLGLTKSQVTELRRRHGIASLGRITAEAARRQSRSAP